MPIPETQLETWSAQGSVQQSASTYQTIRNVLNDNRSAYHPKRFDIFLQGSYGNDTNIYRDSDVDIVIRLDSVYYSDTSALSADEKANYDRHFSKAEYSLADFKEEVAAWLRANFGDGVDLGNKAIYVPGNGTRRDADVLACAVHRDYLRYPSYGDPTYREGIVFWTRDSSKIVNYPKQHSSNCTDKHQATNSRFKPTVRIFKNMRNKMIGDGLIGEGLAPSYFLEGLIWNVPNQFFVLSHRDTVSNCINYILNQDRSQFTCANGIHWLLREGHPVCWHPANYEVFIYQLRKLWA